MKAPRPRFSGSILLFVVLLGCGTQAGVATDNPWQVAHDFFTEGFSDPSLRISLTLPNSQTSFILPERIDSSRYGFLRIARLERLDEGRFAGQTDLTIDGWPWSLNFELARVKDKWLVSRISSREEQERIVKLLGTNGIPELDSAQRWDAGLAGRRDDGRVSGPVVLVVLGGRVFVDGTRPIPYSRGLVVEALKEALSKRRRIAQQAHSNYWPHVALAMARGTPAVMTVDLAKWSMEAGAEFVQLIVRQRNGSRGWLPIARTRLANPDSKPIIARIRQDSDAINLRVAGRRSSKLGTTLQRPIDAQKLSRSLAPTHPVTGSLISVSPLSTYENLARLVADIHQALPDRPVGFDGGQP